MSHPIPMSVDSLLARAREITGIDIIDHDVVEPLTVMHRSLGEESGLSEAGALAHQNKLLRLLANRLRMQRDFAMHPEIAEQKIEAPIIVYGMGRSGTTKTQKLLSVSGDFNWLPFWKGYSPALYSGSREESPDARIRDAEEYCRWFDRQNPDSKLGHAFETHEPEEDTTLTELCFRTMSFIGFAETPSYLQWIGSQSPLAVFECLRDSLKYLQWQGLADPSKRWLLKAPTYYGLEPALLQVFPDAVLVMTHRSPLQTVPSACKLIAGFRVPFSAPPPDPAMMSAGFSMMLDLHLAHRQQIGFKVLDVHFDEVTHSVETLIEKVYAHAGVTLSAASLQRMRQWVIDNPMHKNGAFRYSLEEFGLSESAIREQFSGYVNFVDKLKQSFEQSRT